MARGILYVATYPTTPEQADEFNRWYDEVHLPEIVALPGYVSARRFAPRTEGAPYIALYEMESDDLQKTADDMMAMAGRGEFTMSETLQTDPPSVAHVWHEITSYAPEQQ